MKAIKVTVDYSEWSKISDFLRELDGEDLFSYQIDNVSFVIVANGDQISVMNTADRNFTLTVVDMLGRAVYAGNGAGMMTVNKQDIDAHCVIFVLTDGVSKKVQKMMLH